MTEYGLVMLAAIINGRTRAERAMGYHQRAGSTQPLRFLSNDETDRAARPRQMIASELITVAGPVSWSWRWPAGDPAHMLDRARRVVSHDRSLPVGEYRVSVAGLAAVAHRVAVARS